MTNLPDRPQVYEFGDIRLDLRMLAVTRRGEPVALEPKAFEVLRFLVEHRDRLVTKDELLDVVWKDVFVTPNVLTRAIAQLRKALGDEAHDSKYIETVAKRGYRFIGQAAAIAEQPLPTAPAESPAVPPPAPLAAQRARVGRAWVVAAALVLLTAAAWVWLRTTSTASAPPVLASIQRLTSSGDVIDAVISRDGKYVAYVRSAGGAQSLWIRQTEGASTLQLRPPAPVGYWGLAFAPDSGSIYYAIKGQPPHGDPAGTLYTIPVLPGPPPRQLASGIDSAVTFSPDGRRIAYFRVERQPAGTSALMIANADGTGARALATQQAPYLFVPEFFAAPSWSPDGTRIASGIQDDFSFSSKLVTIDAADGSQVILQDDFGHVGFTAWLPDESGIVFAGQSRLSWATPPQLWIQPAEGGPARRLTTDITEYRNVSVTDDARSIVSVGTDHLASLWSAEATRGGRVTHIPSMRGDGLGGAVSIGDRVIFNGSEGGAYQIWSMNRDGSDRRQVTTQGWNGWPAVSADGLTIYYVSYGPSGPGIWHAGIDGRNARQLASVTSAALLRLSADERWLYFMSQTAGAESTWRLPVGGGAPSLVVRGLGWATPSPDGRWIAGLWRADPHSALLLTVFAADGGPPVYQFPGNYAGGGGERVHWSRDSASLLYLTTERSNVWRRSLSGGEPEQLTSFEDGSIFGFAPTPSGDTLILSRGPSVRDAFLIQLGR